MNGTWQSVGRLVEVIVRGPQNSNFCANLHDVSSIDLSSNRSPLMRSPQQTVRRGFGALLALAARQWRRGVDHGLQPFGLTEAT